MSKQSDSIFDLVKEEWPTIRQKAREVWGDLFKSESEADAPRHDDIYGRTEKEVGYYRLETWDYHGHRSRPGWSDVAKSINKDDLIAYAINCNDPVRIYDSENNLLFESGISKEKRSL